MPVISCQVQLIPVDNRRLADLSGQCDEHIHQIEKQLDVQIHNRGHIFHIEGEQIQVQQADKVLQALYEQTETGQELTPEQVYLALQEFSQNGAHSIFKIDENAFADRQILTKAGAIKARTENQYQYLSAVNQYDLNFAIGPAGTGKTYLAVACAVEALEKEHVQRIILTRPAVEAGERLGFLPGDLTQKVDPYLRPLYDALYVMIGYERVGKLIERNIIEVAPLAYMRGRTLNDAFIILDESQNTTREQMKMFLTRIGFGSKAIVTGDITQVDLPKGIASGLMHAMEVLKHVKAIGFHTFEAVDVVRHPVVQAVVRAYDRYENPSR